MLRSRFIVLAAAIWALLSGCGGSGGSNSSTFYAVTSAGQLVWFTASNPAQVVPIAVTGTLAPLQAVEFLPYESKLYAVDTEGRAYKIAPNSGVATLVGTPFGSGLMLDLDAIVGTNFLRVVDTADDNLRIDTTTGAVTTDVALAYAPGDAHEGANPQIVGVAHDNGVLGVTYAIDSANDSLVTIGTPESANSGVLHTRGSLGVDTDDSVGMEITSNGYLYAALHTSGASKLYFVDPATGATFLAGTIGTADPIVSLTAAH